MDINELHPIVRIAEALEKISESLYRIAHPPIVVSDDAKILYDQRIS